MNSPFGILCVLADGQLINPASRRFRDVFKVEKPDFDLADFAVRNHGCISLRTETDCIYVRLRPKLVGTLTLQAAARFINARSIPTVSVTQVGGATRELHNDDTLLFRLKSLSR